MFADRADAGRRLADLLAPWAGRDDVLAIGLARGGVVVAAEIARLLPAGLTALVVRKIRAPRSPELALGALAVWGDQLTVVRNEHVLTQLHIRADTFDDACAAELAIARDRVTAWRPAGGSLARHVAILVDDGTATGATMRAAARALRTAGADRLVGALPVASASARDELRAELDELHCVDIPRPFGSVGRWYRDFTQVDDATVAALLGVPG